MLPTLKKKKVKSGFQSITIQFQTAEILLFNTVNVIKEEKQHYIFRKYGKSANVIAEQTFTFDYQCLLTTKSIEKAPGVFDYVLEATPINYKKSTMKTTAPNNFEFFYVDGETFDIKEHVAFTAPNSKWIIDKVLHVDGATYLIGGSSASNTEYNDIYPPPKKADFMNLQLAKIQDGKVVYAKSFLNSDLNAALKTVDGLKSNKTVNGNVMLYSTLNVVNGKVVYQGQQHNIGNGTIIVLDRFSLNGSMYGDLQAFIFDENGNLDAVLSKQEKKTARSSVAFTKDGSKLLWLLEDIGKYNEIKKGTISSKKASEIVNALSIVSYDFNAKNISSFQNLENNDWAINHNNPVLMKDDSKIMLLGNKITKKTKEKELVLVTITK